MISDQEIERVIKAGTEFKPALLAAKYHADTDRVELVTSWCILIVDRQRIEELRDLPLHALETIALSPVGVHVDSANIDINAAGLLSDISKQLMEDVANSF